MHLRIIQDAPEYLPIISEYYMIDDTINIIDARYGTRIIPGETDIANHIEALSVCAGQRQYRPPQYCGPAVR